MILRSKVWLRYRKIGFTAMRYCEHGLALWAEHFLIAYIISGLILHAVNMRPPVILMYSVELTRLSTSIAFINLIKGSDG
jgi:hypothetical protein